MEKGKGLKTLLTLIGIALGVFLLAIGLVLFLEPNTIAPGGVTGFAIVFKKVTGIPVYITN
ncbi:MAG: YitT family protein, partial [Tissierellia bacterium]|nr:YitT family protein [Tissierellia bacterium]